jgi:hypothetical protein
MSDKWTPPTLAKSKPACIRQGNKWEKGVCMEVSVKDFCIDRLNYEHLGTKEHMGYTGKKGRYNVYAKRHELPPGAMPAQIGGEKKTISENELMGKCYKTVYFNNYKKAQMLRFSLDKDDAEFLRSQKLNEKEVGRAIELISNKRLYEDQGPWLTLSEALVEGQKITDKQIDEAAQVNTFSLRKVYETRKLPKEIIQTAIDFGTNVNKIWLQDLNEKQVKKLIDLGYFDRYIEDLTRDKSKFKTKFNYDAVFTYAVEKGETGSVLYTSTKLPSEAIDIAMKLQPKHRELHERLSQITEDQEENMGVPGHETVAIEYMLEKKLLPDEIHLETHRWLNLEHIYEYQKLTKKQVEAAINLGWHLPILLSYQKLSKTQLDTLVTGIEKTKGVDSAIFNALWGLQDLPKDLRTRLAKAAGISETVGLDAHFVWHFIHPKKVPDIAVKLKNAVEKRRKWDFREMERLKERYPKQKFEPEVNPMKEIIGSYPVVIT